MLEKKEKYIYFRREEAKQSETIMKTKALNEKVRNAKVARI